MAASIKFRHGALIQGRRGKRSGVLDAIIDETYASDKKSVRLYVIINLYFRDAWKNPKVNINGNGKSKWKDTDGNTHWVDIEPWKRSNLRVWSNKFVADTEKYWDRKLYLITPSWYRRFDVTVNSRVYRPNVWCRFELNSVYSPSSAHYRIDVANVKDGNAFFRSHSVLYDSNDKTKTMRHEVGHLIGLAHPGGCSNAKEAYDDLPGFPDDVMGRGGTINTRHARPWRIACRWLTDTKSTHWIVAKEYQKPKLIRK